MKLLNVLKKSTLKTKSKLKNLIREVVKEELSGDSRCCNAKLLDKKPIAKHEG